MFFKNSKLLRSILQENKWRLSFIYGLNILEQLGYLLIPAAAGMLINTFISGEGYGLLAFSVCYIGWQGISTYRKIVDTQTFTKVYNQIVVKTIEHHKMNHIETTVINARMELLKQVVTFFEIDLPFLVNSLVSMFGAAGLLFFYNPKMMFVCLIIILPSLILNYFFGKKMLTLTNQVNDEYEKQIEVIENQDISEIETYLKNIRKLNVKKSSIEAYNFGMIEIFVFIMIVASLYIICKTPNINYGDIVATYGYILRFAYSFDFIPHLTERVATMKDIQSRLEEVYQD